MPNTKYASGPWELRENAPYDSGGWVIYRGRGQENKTICRLPYGNMVPCPDTAERRENTANAQLIAAAPELLESLIEIWPLFESCIGQGNGELDGDREAISRAQAAIAKALGKTPPISTDAVTR